MTAGIKVVLLLLYSYVHIFIKYLMLFAISLRVCVHACDLNDCLWFVWGDLFDVCDTTNTVGKVVCSHVQCVVYTCTLLHTQPPPDLGTTYENAQNRCTGREQGRGKGTRSIGSGLFGTFGTHIKDCEVLLSK